MFGYCCYSNINIRHKNTKSDNILFFKEIKELITGIIGQIIGE